MKLHVWKAILKNTMKNVSLRFLAPIAISSQVLALMSPGAFVLAADSSLPSTKLAQLAGEGKLTDSEPEKSSSANAKSSSEKSSTSKDEADQKSAKAEKKSKKSEKKAKGDKSEKDGKETEEAELTPEEAAAVAAAAERAKALKAISTPFNSPTPGAADEDALSLPPSDNSLGARLHISGPDRFGSGRNSRVYYPGKLAIGKPAEFVIKGRPGSHAAIAMADKNSGAKSIGSVNLRLGADRKLVAAGTIPPTGVLSLLVDMPIQGDLIGQAVFFETVIWQKPDFSDTELAVPIRPETAVEIADKPNAIIVSEDKAHKRGVRFVPEAAVPQYQQQNNAIDSGRP